MISYHFLIQKMTKKTLDQSVKKHRSIVYDYRLTHTDQTDPADERDDLLSLIKVQYLYEREADGHCESRGRVDHWTSVDAILSVILYQHRY